MSSKWRAERQRSARIPHVSVGNTDHAASLYLVAYLLACLGVSSRAGCKGAGKVMVVAEDVSVVRRLLMDATNGSKFWPTLYYE